MCRFGGERKGPKEVAARVTTDEKDGREREKTSGGWMNYDGMEKPKNIQSKMRAVDVQVKWIGSR